MVKRLYHGLIVLALIHLFAIVGFVGYLFTSGRLNVERIEQIAGVLRGEYDEEDATATAAVEQEAAPTPSETELRRLAARKEYYSLVADRHLRELEDRRKLDQQIQLETQRLLEDVRRREEALAKSRKEVLAQDEQAGFERQLEVLASMDPRKAKDLLKDHTAPADVVRLLMAMDQRKVTRIAEACKTPGEMLWIGGVMKDIGRQGTEPGVTPASTGKNTGR